MIMAWIKCTCSCGCKDYKNVSPWKSSATRAGICDPCKEHQRRFLAKAIVDVHARKSVFVGLVKTFKR